MAKKRITVDGFEQALLCAGLVHYKIKAKKELKGEGMYPATEKAIKKLHKKLDCGGTIA